MRIKLLQLGHKYRVFLPYCSIVGWLSDGRAFSLRASGTHVFLRASGTTSFARLRHDFSLRASGTTFLCAPPARLFFARLRHDFSLRASGTDFSLRASGTTVSLRASGTTVSLRASGTTFSLRASGTTFSLRASGTTFSLRASGTTFSLRASGTTYSLRASGTTFSARLRHDLPSRSSGEASRDRVEIFLGWSTHSTADREGHDRKARAILIGDPSDPAVAGFTVVHRYSRESYGRRPLSMKLRSMDSSSSLAGSLISR